VLLIGVAGNLLLAVPTFVQPEASAAMIGITPPMPVVWLRFAALLMILLSCFYIPGGLDPTRYRASAWLAVASRLAGVIFFGLQPPEYRFFAIFDLVFFVPQVVLLTLAGRTLS
jgi:hypothetical protein